MTNSTLLTDYVQRGTFAARPASPATPGTIASNALAFYWATDTLVLYMWTGAAWVIVGSGTGSVPPASAPAFHPGFASGQYYTTPLLNVLTTGAMAQNTLYAVPFYVPVATTFTKASVRISTLDAGKLIDIGIYADGNGVPTTLEFDCGTLSTSATGQIEITGLTLALSAGWHWIALATNSASVVNVFGSGSTDALMGALLGMVAVNTVTTGVTAAWTFSAGALPTPFPALTYVTNTKQPLAFLRL